ncbi:MAG: hypothetical protein OXH96_02070 [Spirochaetaceae bacterium]|nr:hypothetical protein [Spirochaetaceae bacterium]
MGGGVDDRKLRATFTSGIEHPRQTRHMGGDRHRPIGVSEIAPYARRSLWVKVDQHRVAAGEFVRDGETDRDSGVAGASLL